MGELEQAVLKWIAAETGSAELAAQIDQATESKRDFMGTGLFMYLQTADDLPLVPSGVRPVCPYIRSEMLMDGAGVSLFMKNGRLHYLEIYSRGGFMPETMDSWRLEAETP
jgi:hypothetical protein